MLYFKSIINYLYILILLAAGAVIAMVAIIISYSHFKLSYKCYSEKRRIKRFKKNFKPFFAILAVPSIEYNDVPINSLLKIDSYHIYYNIDDIPSIVFHATVLKTNRTMGIEEYKIKRVDLNDTLLVILYE